MNGRRNVVVSVAYSVDAAARDRFRGDLEALLETPVAIVDLSGVDYLDSTGISELLTLYRKRNRSSPGSSRLVVGPADGTVARIVSLAGLSEVFTIFESVKEALA